MAPLESRSRQDNKEYTNMPQFHPKPAGCKRLAIYSNLKLGHYPVSGLVDDHQILMQPCKSWPARRLRDISNCFSAPMRRQGFHATNGCFAKCVVISASARGRTDPSLGPGVIGLAPSFSVATSFGRLKPNRWKPLPTTGASVEP